MIGRVLFCYWVWYTRWEMEALKGWCAYAHPASSWWGECPPVADLAITLFFFFFLPLHYYNYVSYLFFFFLTCFVWWFRTDIGKRDFYYWFWLGEISGKIEPSALHRLLSLLLIKLGLPYGISASCVCQFQKPEAGTGIIHKCLKQTAGDRVEAK